MTRSISATTAMAGLLFASGFSKGMQASNYTSELAARGATQPNPVYHVYDINAAVGGPIVFGAGMPGGLIPAAFAQEAKQDAPAAAPSR